jgi:transposase
MTESPQQSTNRSSDRSWEELSKERSDLWSDQLEELRASSELLPLQILKAKIDVQTSLAELRIKARQADKAWLFAWSPVILPLLAALIGIIGTLITLWANGRLH